MIDEAQLLGADLGEAHLRRTFLINADLRGADLGEANLSGAILTGADLRLADLSRANFRRANLREANLSRASLYETIFSNTDLTDTKGLDACNHQGPSTIDYRTLAKSGKLPLEFLRGCGLPDVLINYLPSMLNEPIQFYSCFISHSHQDEAFVRRLYDALQGNGVRCWYAPEDIQGGKKIHEQVDEAIRIHDKLLLVLSEQSMNSDWCELEIRKAREREVQEKRRILFPIRLVDYEAIRNWTCFNADTRKDSAREIRD